MIRLFANADYDFIKWRRWAYGLTAAIILPGFSLFLVRGLNYSIEFTGGTLIQVQTVQPVGTERIRGALDAAGIRDAEIQQFGGPNEYKVQARLGAAGTTAEGTTQATAAAVDSALTHGLGAGQFSIVRTEAVGPKVGRELQGKAFLAIFFSFIVTLIYLAFRFEWRFGLAAVLATFHDILTTIAFIRYLDLEVSLVVVGAVLTMVGYSLNDTIIIFDRVRENLRKFRRQNLYEILNLSINETLPRSVLTHGTTMATTIALVLLAGEVLRPFALVMTFAIFTGTFSSIYIAAPLLMYIEKRWPGQDARGARILRHGGTDAQGAPSPTTSTTTTTPTPPPAGGAGGGARSKAAV
ncbi:MAG TPA: protein translocase subunit SecF [Gemmatimonadales bacterium]|nr:protein translocase subunit SecF [Gemmatimonadales bacterium]